MTTKFIHLTDTHLIGDGLLYGGNPRRRLSQAVDSINAEHGDARFVVITGDLTHWGEPAAYAVLAAELDRLAMPVVPLVGNHDDPAAFATAFPDAKFDPDGFVQSTLYTEFGRCLFLDTTQTGSHAGHYCATRRAWLADRLTEDDAPVVLFLHHPPFRVGISALDAIRMQDDAAFYAVLAPCIRRVRHIFIGHVHRAVFGTWRGMSFSAMRGLNHQVALDLSSGAPVIGGNFEPPAYGVVLADEQQIVVHLHDFGDRSPRFPLEPLTEMSGRAYALGLRHAGWGEEPA